MLEATLFLEPLVELINILQRERDVRQNNNKAKNKKTDEALELINNALLESMQYVEKNSTDREKEYELAKLWSKASIKTREIDPKFAEDLGIKSQYWSRGFKWSKEEFIEKNVDFDSLHKKINDLL